MGVDCLIFSKDRACQLDLLLRSIGRFAPGFYRSLSVLYTFTSREFLRGYQTCFSEHAEAKFVLEHSFEMQVRYWLSLGHDHDPVSFLVDDDVFYRDVPLTVIENGIPWSLRGGDYWYPFSVDGNVYRRFHVKTLLGGQGSGHPSIRFRDPTELEAFGHEERQRLPFVEVSPALPPCLVGVPANRVSARSGMPHMGVDQRMLNDQYLEGKRLEVVIPDGLVLGAHEALDYDWTDAKVPA